MYENKQGLVGRPTDTIKRPNVLHKSIGVQMETENSLENPFKAGII